MRFPISIDMLDPALCVTNSYSSYTTLVTVSLNLAAGTSQGEGLEGGLQPLHFSTVKSK